MHDCSNQPQRQIEGAFLVQSGAAQAYSCELELDRNEVRIANIWADRDGPLEGLEGQGQ